MCNSQPTRYVVPATMPASGTAQGAVSPLHHHQQQQQPALRDSSSSRFINPHPFIVSGFHAPLPAVQVDDNTMSSSSDDVSCVDDYYY